MARLLNALILVGVTFLVQGPSIAQPAENEHIALTDRGAQKQRRIILIPPVVEFLAMESNAAIEAPKADRADLSKKISDKLKLKLEAIGRDVSVLDTGMLETAVPGIAPEDFFTLIRRADFEQPETGKLQTFLAEEFPQSDVMIVRIRFYLEYWARSERVFQIMDSVFLRADRSDKRMMVDARIHRGDNLDELWRGLAQERVTPRASEKGINRAIASIVEEYLQNANTPGERDD